MGLVMKVPIIAINYKAYKTAFGEKAIQIAKSAEKISKEIGIEIIVIPPYTELRRIVEVVDIPVYAQHAEPVNLGAHTGYIPLPVLKEIGVKGTLLNHSEHRIKLDEIVKGVQIAKSHGLEVLVCADTAEASAAVAAISPTAIAVEPPELIGTGIAVSKAKPELIINTVKAVREVNKEVIILTGAGITNAEDVEAAIKLGTAGVLVASAIMKAQNPEKVIREMAEAAYKTWK